MNGNNQTNTKPIWVYKLQVSNYQKKKYMFKNKIIAISDISGPLFPEPALRCLTLKRTKKTYNVRCNMGGTQSNETKFLLEIQDLYEDIEQLQLFARFEEHPFAHGVSRWAYRGKLLDTDEQPATHPPMFCDSDVVVKVFKQDFAVSIGSWIDDYLNSFISSKCAARWNTFRPTNKPIEFMARPNPSFRPLTLKIPLLAEMDKRVGKKVLGIKFTPDEVKQCIKKNEWVALEPFIHGQYQKFTSNSGWVGDDIGATVPAFMHFSWIDSHGSYVVSDIQGTTYLAISMCKNLNRSEGVYKVRAH